MSGRLAGRSALVAGAGSRSEELGNGRATAILFAREGARVLCADQSLDRAQATVDLISREGGVAQAAQADVSRSEDCARLAREAEETYGALRIAHYNVGIEARSPLDRLTDEEWTRVLDVNLTGAMQFARAVAPRLVAAGGGALTFVSTIAALRTTPLTAYAASKAGLLGLVVSLAGQLAPGRVRVNAIAPGLIYSAMVAGGMNPETRERRRLAAPITDEGTPWDVGWAAVFLASDEARWITGQTLVVDGGFTIATRDYAL